jgi:catechol-2,3-dioxygenase
MSATAQGTCTEIGHVHLMVADLERSIRFYADVLGFEPAGRVGEEIAFLTSGDYHHRPCGRRALGARCRNPGRRRP